METSKKIIHTKEQKNALIVVFIAIFTDMLIYGMIVPFMSKYASSLNASQTEIGFLFSSYSISLLIATPFCGILSDRIGRRRPMLFGLLGLAIATLLFAFANNLWLLFTARILQGFAAAITWSAGLALLADLYSSEERGKAMGMAIGGQTLGILIGPSLGGWLFQLGGYMLPFIFATGLALIDGLLRLILLPNDGKYLSSKNENELSTFGVLRNHQLLFIIGIIIIGAAAPSALEPTLPLHLQRTLNVTPGIIGSMWGITMLAGGLTFPIIGSMSSRIGHTKVSIIGLTMLTVALPLVSYPNTIWLEICTLAFLGVSMGMVLAPCMPKLADISEKSGINSYGIILGTYNMAYSVGMMIGPSISGILTDMFGIKLSYLAIAGVVFIYMIFLVITSRSFKNLHI